MQLAIRSPHHLLLLSAALLTSLLLNSCALYEKDLSQKDPQQQRLFSTQGNNPFAKRETQATETAAQTEANSSTASSATEQQQNPSANQNPENTEQSGGGIGGFFRSLFASKDKQEEPEEKADQSNQEATQEAPTRENSSATEEISASENAEEEESQGGFFSGVGKFFRGLFSGGDKDQEPTEEQLAAEQVEDSQQASPSQARPKPTSSRQKPRRQNSRPSNNSLPPLPPLESDKLPVSAQDPDTASEVLQDFIKKRDQQQTNSSRTTASLPPIVQRPEPEPPQPEARPEPSTSGTPRQPLITLPPAGNPPSPSNGAGIATPDNPLGPINLP